MFELSNFNRAPKIDFSTTRNFTALEAGASRAGHSLTGKPERDAQVERADRASRAGMRGGSTQSRTDAGVRTGARVRPVRTQLFPDFHLI
jgi:hypothetical protein